MDAFDRVFLHHVKQAKKLYRSRSRQEQIRVEQWMLKLSEVPAGCATWKRNRNLYSTLLLSLLREGSSLTEPFDKRPSSGPLPQLASYLALTTREKEAAERRRAQRSTVWDDIVDSVMRNAERGMDDGGKQREGRSSSRGRKPRRRSTGRRAGDSSLSPPAVSRSPHTRHTPELAPREDRNGGDKHDTERFGSSQCTETVEARRNDHRRPSADHDDEGHEQKDSEDTSPRRKRKKNKMKNGTAREDPLAELRVRLLEDQLQEAQEENVRLRQGATPWQRQWNVPGTSVERNGLRGESDGSEADGTSQHLRTRPEGDWERWERNFVSHDGPFGLRSRCDTPASSVLGSTHGRFTGKLEGEKQDSPITDSDFGSLCSDCFQHQPLREEPRQSRAKESSPPVGGSPAQAREPPTVPGTGREPLGSFLDEFRRKNAAVSARVAALTQQSATARRDWRTESDSAAL